MTHEDFEQTLQDIDPDEYAKAISQILPILSTWEGVEAMREFKERYPNLQPGIRLLDEHARLHRFNAPMHGNLAAGMLLGLMGLQGVADMPDAQPAHICQQPVDYPLFLEEAVPREQ